MKLFSFVLSAFAAISFARALPESTATLENAAAGSTASNITVHFTTPRYRYNSLEYEVEFNVTIPATDLPCGATLDDFVINGVHLTPESYTAAGDIKGHQTLTLTAPTTSVSLPVHIEWQHACRQEQIAILTLTVIADGGNEKKGAVYSPPSVVISYKHGLAPEVNNVLSQSLETFIGAPDAPKFGTQPKDVDIPFSISNSQTPLEFEYAKLKDIKQRMLQLSQDHRDQERKILSLMNEDFGQCHGMVCYLQTAFNKIPELFQLAKMHFKHGCEKSRASIKHRPCGANNANDLGGPKLEGTVGKIVSRTTTEMGGPTANALIGVASAATVTAVATPTSELDPQGTTLPSTLAASSPSNAEQANPSRPDPEQHSPSSSPTTAANNPLSPTDHAGRPPWSFHGRPHPFSSDEDSSFRHRPDPPHEDSPDHDHHGPKHRRPKIPHPAPRHKHFKLIIAIAGATSSTLIILSFIKLLQHYCMNPRVRADRLARIEECRNKRAYKKAARQYRFRRFLGRFRRGRGDETADYEEKRAMLRRGGSVADDDGSGSGSGSGNVVQADINSLRRAHEIVSELVRAEEGRSLSRGQSMMRVAGGSSMVQQQRPLTLAHELPVGPRAHSDDGSMTTLPPYAPPPPRYSMELSRDTEVVDGFRYTPSNSAATNTSSASSFILEDESEVEDGVSVVVPPTECESSVVDCRSRISIDTERTGEIEKRNRKSLELAGERFGRDFS